MCEGFLHYVFRCLPIADHLSQKPQQTGSHFSIKGIERLRLSATNPLPQFVVLSQSPVSKLLFGLGTQKVHHKSELSNSQSGKLPKERDTPHTRGIERSGNRSGAQPLVNGITAYLGTRRQVAGKATNRELC